MYVVERDLLADKETFLKIFPDYLKIDKKSEEYRLMEKLACDLVQFYTSYKKEKFSLFFNPFRELREIENIVKNLGKGKAGLECLAESGILEMFSDIPQSLHTTLSKVREMQNKENYREFVREMKTIETSLEKIIDNCFPTVIRKQSSVTECLQLKKMNNN